MEGMVGLLLGLSLASLGLRIWMEKETLNWCKECLDKI